MTLAYIFDHAVCCASAAKFGPNLASHYKPVKNEIKFVELSVVQLRNESWFVELFEVCSASKHSPS